MKRKNTECTTAKQLRESIVTWTTISDTHKDKNIYEIDKLHALHYIIKMHKKMTIIIFIISSESSSPALHIQNKKNIKHYKQECYSYNIFSIL